MTIEVVCVRLLVFRLAFFTKDYEVDSLLFWCFQGFWGPLKLWITGRIFALLVLGIVGYSFFLRFVCLWMRLLVARCLYDQE